MTTCLCGQLQDSQWGGGIKTAETEGSLSGEMRGSAPRSVPPAPTFQMPGPGLPTGDGLAWCQLEGGGLCVLPGFSLGGGGGGLRGSWLVACAELDAGAVQGGAMSPNSSHTALTDRDSDANFRCAIITLHTAVQSFPPGRYTLKTLRRLLGPSRNESSEAQKSYSRG